MLERLMGMWRTSLHLLLTKIYKLDSILRNIKTGKNNKTCDICGWQGKYYDSFYNIRTRKREVSICPRCKAVDRQRGIYKYLKEYYSDTWKGKVLEVAPHSSNPINKALGNADYASIDMDDSRAMRQMDLTALTFADAMFDIIVCIHVLEHIQDELKAIQEIYRALRKGGKALFSVPIGYYGDPNGTHTIEFGKRMFYGDEGHYRSYGLDFNEKLQSVGFNVDVVKVDGDNEYIYACGKRQWN